VRNLAVAVLAVLAAGAVACAPKPVLAPIVTTSSFPDFIRPAVPSALASDPAAPGFDRAWRFLQAGDLRNADREVASALHLSPGFYPAETAAGYVSLARKDPKAALDHFDRSLVKDANSASALVGRGDALVALDRSSEAAAAFDAAVTADPALSDVRRRAEVLRFRGVEQGIANARALVRAGKLDEAERAYQSAIGGSPDSAFLYRELGAVERQRNDPTSALENYRKALGLDPSDAASWAAIGDVLDASGDAAGAVNAFSRSLGLEPSDAVAARRVTAQSHADAAKLPDQYRAIDEAAQISRADLAALVGVRLAAPLQRLGSREPGVVTDVRNNWAEPWILAVLRAGVMEPFANHTFQPRAVVHRTDLAQVVARLLVAVATPQAMATWRGTHPAFPDLAGTHLAYPDASLAVASGVLPPADDRTFQPSRAVSGPEAVQAIEKIQVLAAKR
jgi:tetratricopeptide (TPR) repeat protein